MSLPSLPSFTARSWILAGMGFGAASLSSAQNPRFEPLREMLPAEAEDTLGVELGDVDDDGDLDALTINSGSAQGRLYLNDGSALFKDASSNLPPGTLKPYAAALGDVDGDGDLDAVLGRVGGVGLLLNDGSGSFVDASNQVHADVGNVLAVLLMDLEGDTDLDLVVGVWGSPSSAEKNRVLINDGAGSFSLAFQLWQPKEHAITHAFAAGDLDDDAYVDLVAGYYGDQNLLYMNEGGTSLTPAPLSPPAVTYNNTKGLALVDVDGDLDLDLVSSTGGVEDDYLFFNYLDVGLWGVANLGGKDITDGLALGDLDADGDPDLLLANQAGLENQPGVRYLQNIGAFVSVQAKLSDQGSLHPCHDVALGDLDGDADLDAWIATGSSITGGEQDCIYLNDGGGALVDATGAGALSAWYTGTFVWGDVDGDADADLVTGELTGYGKGNSRLFLNNGQGELTEDTTALPAGKEDISALALGDLDGDQDLDLMIAYDGNPDSLLLNDGQGAFLVEPSTLPSPDQAKAIALVDVEGDGDQDAFFGTHKFSQNKLHLNDGAAHFTDATGSLPWDGDGVAAVATADVDGDGDLDIATANDTTKPRLYVNSGGGSFADGTDQFPAGSKEGRDLVFADVDGDSDLDLAVADLAQDRLLLNDGRGVYQDASDLLPLAASVSADAGDFDQDGDMDLVLAEWLQQGTAACHVYENDGAGSFQTQADPGIVETLRGVAWVDLNGDAWLDLFTLGSDDRHRVYFNLERTVSRTGVPRVGKPLGMELHGTSGGAWFLAWSLGTAQLELPPFGTLQLDPATLHVHAWGALDAAGAATSIVDVPDNPALTGLAIYWQGLIGEPLYASTLETTTLTAL